jgi:hypothetical protein
MWSQIRAVRLIPILAAVAVVGCHTQVIEVVEEPRVEPDPVRPAVQLAGRIDLGSPVEGQLEGDLAVGYATVLAQGAGLVVNASGAPEVLVYGPLDASGWDAAPAIARGAAPLEVTAPSAGTYLIAARGPSGAFTLSAECTSGECRAECGGDGSGCPEGAGCALVMCIRAPCPSYCHPLVESPAPEPRTDGSEGSVCGTRGVPPCAEGLFCQYPDDAACGETDRPGICQPPPQMCTREYRAVCGCDGRTYGNRCTAYGAGTSVRSEGECPTAQASEPEPEPEPSEPRPRRRGGRCHIGGCGGEICADEPMASGCVALASHACYRGARCTRQADGECGWTMTPELRACLGQTAGDTQIPH